MSPGHDEGPGGYRSLTSTIVHNLDRSQASPSRRQKPLLHAVAQATLVTARTGRQRYLLVYRCHCGSRHVSHARVVADVCRRQAACGLGPVELHLSQAVAA